MPPVLNTVFEYMRRYAGPMGERIMQAYPPLHAPGDPVSPRVAELLREPLAAQELAMMGTAKYLIDHDAARIVGEMGTGKTFMRLGTCYIHANGKQHTGVVMCPPHPSLNRFLRIFSFLMRASNVEGGNPSVAAAPLGPDIRPRLCVRADTIIFRSCSESSSLTSSRVCGVRCEQGIDGSHELSTQNTSSGLRITDLSTMF